MRNILLKKAEIEKDINTEWDVIARYKERVRL